MTKEIIYIFIGLLSLVTGGAVAVVNNTLKCYQCEVPGKVDLRCHENDLRICPSNQAYDRCIINYRKNESGHFIIRKCALAPCTFRAREVDSLFSTDCELDWSTNDCVKCCREDGCNRENHAHSNLFPHQTTNFLLTIIPIIFSLHYYCFTT